MQVTTGVLRVSRGAIGETFRGHGVDAKFQHALIPTGTHPFTVADGSTIVHVYTVSKWGFKVWRKFFVDLDTLMRAGLAKVIRDCGTTEVA